jgi:Flp pilus assembly protein TadB
VKSKQAKIRHFILYFAYAGVVAGIVNMGISIYLNKIPIAIFYFVLLCFGSVLIVKMRRDEKNERLG